MAVPEEHDNASPDEVRTRRKLAIGEGLSPTVEKMFGALAAGSDEDEEENPAELEVEGGSARGSG